MMAMTWHGQTLRSLKQCIEKTRHRGSRLTVVLAGHPRLKNELRRPAREEIGARTTVLEFEGIQGQQRRYILWALEQCAAAVDPMDIVTADALDLLAERLLTPLQIQHDLTRVLEHAYRVGGESLSPRHCAHHAGARYACAGAHLDAVWLYRSYLSGGAQYPRGRGPGLSPWPITPRPDGGITQSPVSGRDSAGGTPISARISCKS